MKKFIYFGAFVGGLIGSYLPVILGAGGVFSAWSILGSLIGAVLGILVAYKAGKYFEG